MLEFCSVVQHPDLIQIDVTIKLEEKVHNPEVSICVIWPWPISLRYYLNLEQRSRQIMANQVSCKLQGREEERPWERD